MNLFDILQSAVRAEVKSAIDAGAPAIAPELEARLAVEPPRDPSHGDAAANAALLLAKAWRRKPLDIADELAARLVAHPAIASATSAKPGFVNLTLERDFLAEIGAGALAAGADWGKSAVGAGRRVNVEFCSTNPTGPVHVGHARGTVFGDALSRLLSFAGYDVTREYYTNDAGVQIDQLARSVHHRYVEALGRAPGPIADGLYPGAYLVPIGERLAEEFGDQFADAPESAWLQTFRARAVAAMMDLIRDDLATLGVAFDVFGSEQAMIASGAVEEALDDLASRDLVYDGVLPPPKGKPDPDWEPREQRLFRSTAFGDDVDRPLQKSDGSATYFANDIAYHWDKARRGADLLVDVLGADHAGYAKRMKAAVAAFPDERPVGFEVRFCQLVNFLDQGQPLKMSKRAGRFVTVRDVVDEVGADVLRFIMLTRKNDAPLDFDLVAVTQESKDNPVFYVQYAHARICSVFRQAEAMGMTPPAADAARDALALLEHADERAALLKALAFPRVVDQAATSLEPHRIAFYLIDLAGVLHALWTKGKEHTTLRFIQAEDRSGTAARLALLAVMRASLANGLGVLGVEPVAEMR